MPAAAEADAIADEQLAAERREQDHALHHADEPRREVRPLERRAGVLEAAEQEGDEDDRERVVAREGRDDDARVAVAVRSQAVRVGVERRARSRRSGSPRRGRRARRRAPSRRGSCAGCACRSSGRRAASRSSPGPRSRSACGSTAPRGRSRRRSRPGSRAGRRRSSRCVGQLAASGSVLPDREDGGARGGRVPPVRVAVEDQVREDQAGDVVEHQRGDDLVGRQVCLEDARDQGPGRAGCEPGDDHRHDQDRRRLAREQQARRGGARWRRSRAAPRRRC